jgi:iron complex transport system ATP-binding protein
VERAVSASLEARGLGFAYAGAGRGPAPFVLNDVSFAVAPGEVLGVVGPNSAGKTTLIRLLTRVLTPARGQVLLDGVPVERYARSALARRLAVVPQDAPAALPFTVEQLVLMGRYPHGPRRFFETAGDVEAARAAMLRTGVAHLAGTPVARLGGGERQRAALARALAQEPDVLVLDEPTAHLDLRYQVECVALLRRLRAESGTTVVLVSHDLNLAAELCDRLLLLAAGRVVRLGPPAEVLEAELLSRVYGCEITVAPGPRPGRPLVQVAWPAPCASPRG